MSLRKWDEWTEGEKNAFRLMNRDIYTSGEIANKALEIAQRPAPRRVISEYTRVFVSDTPDFWVSDFRQYVSRNEGGYHLATSIYDPKCSWRYARPVPAGWKPGDPLDPPNEGDL